MPPGEIPNPSLDARVRAKDVEKIKEQIEFQTTADKILGLLADEPITIELTKTVSMQFYPPTDEQYIDILSLQGEGSQIAGKLSTLGANKDLTDEQAEQVMPQAMSIINQAKCMLMNINELLAILSVDKSWTADQFKRMPKQYKATIISEISGTKKKKSSPSKSSRRVVGV